MAIFHEDFTPQIMTDLQSVTVAIIHFVKIAFKLPQFLVPRLAKGQWEVRHHIPNPQHPTGWHTHKARPALSPFRLCVAVCLVCGADHSSGVLALARWRVGALQHGLAPYHKRGGAYPFGYQHMCRFYSGSAFALPYFQSLDWYWRLDSDSSCVGRIEDPFDFLVRPRPAACCRCHCHCHCHRPLPFCLSPFPFAG